MMICLHKSTQATIITQLSFCYRHRRTGPVSFRGAKVSWPNILSISWPKIKWFFPNITWFVFCSKMAIWKILVRLWLSLLVINLSFYPKPNVLIGSNYIRFHTLLFFGWQSINFFFFFFFFRLSLPPSMLKILANYLLFFFFFFFCVCVIHDGIKTC